MNILLNIFAGIPAVEPNWIGLMVKGLYEWIGNYGWTMVVFTLILKVIMSPLDIWQRYATKKQSLTMAAMQPMVAKLDQMYANDKQKLNEEKSKLYKKQGYSALGSCLPMILTMVVFFIVFGGLNTYSTYNNVTNYNNLSNKYETVVDATLKDTTLTNIDFTTLVDGDEYFSYKKIYEGYISSNYVPEQAKIATIKKIANDKAIDAVGIYYKGEIQEEWLWIKNVWRADTWVSPMASYDEFIKGGMGAAPVDKQYVNKTTYENIYNAVIKAAPGYGGASWNGLLILPLFSIGFQFLTTFLTTRAAKKKGAAPVVTAGADPTAATNKVMMIIMPLMMGYFAILYTAAFSIYMVTSSIFSMLLMFATNPIIEKMASKKLAKKEGPKASYRR